MTTAPADTDTATTVAADTVAAGAMAVAATVVAGVVVMAAGAVAADLGRRRLGRRPDLRHLHAYRILRRPGSAPPPGPRRLVVILTHGSVAIRLTSAAE
jgi:hypothetical protein